MRHACWLGLVLVVGLAAAGFALSADDIHRPEWLPPSVEDVATALEGLSFDRFVDASYEQYLLRFPQSLTHYGMARQLGVRNDRLNDYSPAYMAETMAIETLIYDRLQTFNREDLSPPQQLTYDVCLWYWADVVRAQAYVDLDYLVTHYYITSRDWDLFDLLTVAHTLSSQQDVEDYVARLAQAATQYDQLVAGLDDHAAKGIVAPQLILAQAASNLRGLAQASARYHPFYTTLSNALRSVPGISSSERVEILDVAASLMEDEILPATLRLYEKLRELEAIAPAGIGYSQYPGGEDYYNHALRHQNQTTLTAAEIHAIGLVEVARLQTEIVSAASALGYPDDLSIRSIYSRVSQDGGTFSGDAIVAKYEEIVEAAKRDITGTIDLLPRATVVVVPDATGGYYRPSNGSRPAEFVAPASGSQPYYAMPTLAYHETIPGHHLQIGLASEMDLSLLQRIEVFLGFTEGWALYSERLAWELGWYEGDPYGNLGRLSDEMMRAVRLVVDTGVHAMGWGFDQAANYFADNTGRPLSFAQSEIRRYMVWPGQSTSYMIGFLRLLDLRSQVQDALGEAFDLAGFHTLLLENGSLPLELLETLVQEYINTQTE